MKDKIAETNNHTIRPYTDTEENVIYGPKTKPTGGAFKYNDGYYEHLYLQRESDVLHINVKGKILNSLNVGFLNEGNEYKAIPEKEFTEAVKEFIYNIEVDKYWNT